MRILVFTFLISLSGCSLFREPLAPAQQRLALHQPFSLEVRGATDAPVKIIEYVSFSCGHCAHSSSKLDRIVQQSAQTYSLELRPIAFDKEGRAAARAALAAAKQGLFWEMSGFLFDNQLQLGPELYRVGAQKLGLDREQFEADMHSSEVRDLVAFNIQEAKELGIKATPTVFINGSPFVGDMDYRDWKRVLEQAAKQSSGKRPQR